MEGSDVQDLERQVAESNVLEDTAAMSDALMPWLATAVVVAALFVAVSWWRARSTPKDADVRARAVYMAQAVVWARGPHRSPSRWLRRKLKRYEQHSWPVLCRDYEAEHMAVFSGTNTGKSQRVVIPMMVRRLRERRVSLAIMDPKGELFAAACPYLGEVAGHPPVHLLSALPKHQSRAVAVDVFATPAQRRRFLRGVFEAQDAKESFWGDAARDMWDSVASALGDADLPTTWAVLRSPAMLDELAARHPEVKAVWAGGQTRGSHQEIRTNAVAPFEGLKERRIARLFDRRNLPPDSAGGPSFDAREVVYVCVTEDDAQQSGALFAGLMAELQHRAVGRRGGAPKVEIVADEAGTCYPLQGLKGYINICRGKGVNIALFFQDYTQVAAKLPRLHDSVIGACELVLVGPTGNEDTKRYAERKSGTAYVSRPTKSDPRNKEKRPRVRAEDVEKLRRGEFYIFERGADPRRVRQRAVWIGYKTFVVPARAKRGRPNLVRPHRPPDRPADPLRVREDPQHGTDFQEERRGSAAARGEAIGSEAEAGPVDAPPEPEQTVPRFVPRGAVPNLRPAQRACGYCGHPNPSTAKTCELGTCGASLT